MNKIEDKHVALVYDTLYKMADNLFKRYHPCDYKMGICIAVRQHGRGGCCGTSCEFLSSSGCTIKNLGCKLYACEYIHSLHPEFSKQLGDIQSLAHSLLQQIPYKRNRQQSIELILKDLLHGGE